MRPSALLKISGWCQGVLFRTKDGRVEVPDSIEQMMDEVDQPEVKYAECEFCILGALNYCWRKGYITKDQKDDLILAMRDSPKVDGMLVHVWNDWERTTKEQVIEVLEKAEAEVLHVTE